MRSFDPWLAARVLWQLRVRRRPYVLSHGITARCNLRCDFCEYWRRPGEEMTTPEIFKMLDEARAFGIGVYNAWTVEPLLRDDLPLILGHAKGLGLITSLITNGKLLRRRAHELSDLDYLSVSVDGTNSYKELRGMDLEDVLAGIRAATEQGHEVLMNCVISDKNLGDLEELVGLAVEMGAWASFEPLHESPEVEGKVWEEMGIRDVERYKRAVDRLIELKKGGAPIINSVTYLKMVRDRRPDFKCHAGDLILHVAPDGTIQSCRVHKEVLGHVSEGISKVWERSIEMRRQTARECEGCLFFGYAENSLLYDFVPEVMAHYEWM